MLPPRVLELVLDASYPHFPHDAVDGPASTPTVFLELAHLSAELMAPTALPAPPLVPAEALAVPPPPRMPMLTLIESPPPSAPVAGHRPSNRPTVRVGANRSQKIVRLVRAVQPSQPPPSLPPPPGSAPIRKAA